MSGIESEVKKRKAEFEQKQKAAKAARHSTDKAEAGHRLERYVEKEKSELKQDAKLSDAVKTHES